MIRVSGFLLAAACTLGTGAAAAEQAHTIKPEVTLRQTAAEERAAQRQAGQPVALVLAEPVYPAYLKRQGVMGCVRVSFDVLADGTTDGLEIASSWPKGMFDASGIKAVFETRYEPAQAVRRSERLFVFHKNFEPEVGSHIRKSPETAVVEHCAGAEPAAVSATGPHKE